MAAAAATAAAAVIPSSAGNAVAVSDPVYGQLERHLVDMLSDEYPGRIYTFCGEEHITTSPITVNTQREALEAIAFQCLALLDGFVDKTLVPLVPHIQTGALLAFDSLFVVDHKTYTRFLVRLPQARDAPQLVQALEAISRRKIAFCNWCGAEKLMDDEPPTTNLELIRQVWSKRVANPKKRYIKTFSRELERRKRTNSEPTVRRVSIQQFLASDALESERRAFEELSLSDKQRRARKPKTAEEEDDDAGAK